MDTQRTEKLLTIIKNRSKSQEDYDNTRKLVLEIVDNQRIILNIDANDIEDAFQTGGVIHGFTASVNAALNSRMRVLIEEVRKKVAQFKPYNRVIVFFLMSDMFLLTMDELLPLNEWLEELPDEAMLRWGAAINSTYTPYTLNAIVLIQ